MQSILILDTIIRSVQAGPSWVNGQHVTIISIKDSDRKKKMAELAGNQKHICVLAILVKFQILCRVYQKQLSTMKKNTMLIYMKISKRLIISILNQQKEEKVEDPPGLKGWRIFIKIHSMLMMDINM
ncbi:hypothetical protein V7124_24250 [Neobacillus niacini]|uniref:hypothetical protein n=1 Tax=Neobacillus niacini TaxID=86668 RepID=UPI002FFFC1A1